MDKILEITLLYDFYGELLTERQKQMFEMYYRDDLSLSEIGEQLYISRQAVRDSLKHAKLALNDYEEKLCLVDKFSKEKASVMKICEIIVNIEKINQLPIEVTEYIEEVKKLIDEIVEI